MRRDPAQYAARSTLLARCGLSSCSLARCSLIYLLNDGRHPHLHHHRQCRRRHCCRRIPYFYILLSGRYSSIIATDLSTVRPCYDSTCLSSVFSMCLNGPATRCRHTELGTSYLTLIKLQLPCDVWSTTFHQFARLVISRHFINAGHSAGFF